MLWLQPFFHLRKQIRMVKQVRQNLLLRFGLPLVFRRFRIQLVPERGFGDHGIPVLLLLGIVAFAQLCLDLSVENIRTDLLFLGNF